MGTARRPALAAGLLLHLAPLVAAAALLALLLCLPAAAHTPPGRGAEQESKR